MSRSLNQATIIGNLTADPQMRSTNNGTSIANFSVATNRSYTDSEGQVQEQVEFHNIVAFGKLAEICEQLLQKGSMAYVSGRLQTRKWDSEDGHTNYKTEIVADQMILLARGKGTPGGPSEDYNNDNYVASQDTGSNNESDSKDKKEKKPAKEENVKAEDIPF